MSLLLLYTSKPVVPCFDIRKCGFKFWTDTARSMSGSLGRGVEPSKRWPTKTWLLLCPLILSTKYIHVVWVVRKMINLWLVMFLIFFQNFAYFLFLHFGVELNLIIDHKTFFRRRLLELFDFFANIWQFDFRNSAYSTYFHIIAFSKKLKSVLTSSKYL